MSASILSVKDFIQFLQRDEESKEFDLHLVLIIVDEFMGSLKSYKQWLKKMKILWSKLFRWGRWKYQDKRSKNEERNQKWWQGWW